MNSLDDVKALREKLVGYIKQETGKSFDFSERHCILALDLFQIYSYREMRGAIMTFEHIRKTWCLNGHIVDIEFHS